MQHRHSDSSAIPDLSAHLHRSLERGPLVIPDHVQAQYQQNLAHHRRSSAESLVAKVRLTPRPLSSLVVPYPLMYSLY